MPAQIPEQRWVLRPRPSQPPHVQAHAGALVYGVSAADDNGNVDVVLPDGTRLRVSRTEIVSE